MSQPSQWSQPSQQSQPSLQSQQYQVHCLSPSDSHFLNVIRVILSAAAAKRLKCNRRRNSIFLPSPACQYQCVLHMHPFSIPEIITNPVPQFNCRQMWQQFRKQFIRQPETCCLTSLISRPTRTWTAAGMKGLSRKELSAMKCISMREESGRRQKSRIGLNCWRRQPALLCTHATKGQTQGMSPHLQESPSMP